MSTELEELIEFLNSPKLEVRKLAVDIVQGLTGSEDGIHKLSTASSPLIRNLVTLLAAEQEEISKASASSLVNLSLDDSMADVMISQHQLLEKSLEISFLPSCKNRRFLFMLLANLSREEAASQRLMEFDARKSDRHYLQKLIFFFSKSPESSKEDEFEYIGNIFVNLTRLRSARAFFLNSDQKSLFQNLLLQFDATSSVRKQAVASIVRNVCFDSPEKISIILLHSQFLWPVLLLPLAGKKVYSDADLKNMPSELAIPLQIERDEDFEPALKVEVGEALYLIASQESGRKALWKVNAPRILQIGYEDEEDEEVMKCYEKLALLFIDGGSFE